MIAARTAIAAAEPWDGGVPLEIPPPPPQRPIEWRRALRALRELLADPDQTDKAFEIFLALDGGHTERFFQRLLADPAGRRLARRRPDLLRRMAERAAPALVFDREPVGERIE